MPNSYWYNILSISICCKSPLSILILMFLNESMYSGLSIYITPLSKGSWFHKDDGTKTNLRPWGMYFHSSPLYIYTMVQTLEQWVNVHCSAVRCYHQRRACTLGQWQICVCVFQWQICVCVFQWQMCVCVQWQICVYCRLPGSTRPR